MHDDSHQGERDICGLCRVTPRKALVSYMNIGIYS